MPSFYPFEMPRHLPLTPPEYYEAYTESKIQAMYQPTHCASHPGPLSQHENYDLYQYSLSKQSGYALAPLTRTTSSEENECWLSNGLVASSSGICAPNSSSVPMLPPIKLTEHSSTKTHTAHSRQGLPAPPGAPVKEDKAIGGVSAHLDYEMDSMAEFVTEMAQGMYDLYESRICLADIDILRSVHSKPLGAPGVSAFRKYVLEVLSSTRLPSSTILLGLHYLGTRMRLLSSSCKYPNGGGQIYRMLTTALLLGSKFLDDNTFQNRSWSEVSNIPVGELNVLELEWLDAIQWNLHVNPEDTQGFSMWRLHWQRWQAKRFERSLDDLKPTPLDVNLQRLQPASRLRHAALTTHSPASDVSAYSNLGLVGYKPSPWHPTPYDTWPLVQSKRDYSPPSAAETGPTTPEWYNGPAECGYTLPSEPSSARSMHSASHYAYAAFQQTAYPTPLYQPYVPKNWNGHHATCNCTYCIPSPGRHLIGSGYRLQPVFG